MKIFDLCLVFCIGIVIVSSVGVLILPTAIAAQAAESNEVTLKEFFEARLAAQESALAARIVSTQQAIDKAETALSLRLDGMNEFRATLRDQAVRFVDSVTMDAKMDAVDTRLKNLEIDRANMEGRLWGISGLLFLVNLAVGVVSIVVSRLGVKKESEPPYPERHLAKRE